MEKTTKKDRSLALFDEGVQDIPTIAEMVGTNPTYVAHSLINAGKSVDYSDLYTPSRPRNRYGDDFNGVLRFKDLDAAKESVRKIGLRYDFYRDLGDRQGQYHARYVALIGYDRAMGLGKTREAKVFAEWIQGTFDEELSLPVENASNPNVPDDEGE
ncbi:MAG: hypothetical protein KY468_18475 [Armatimonadetes bacterium]|nr:hypothetical protein [Armatimonadota bacterium]